jgi:Spy/CpxP family protein refolding chaperone
MRLDRTNRSRLSAALALMLAVTQPALADPSEDMVWTLFTEATELTQEQRDRIRPILQDNARDRLAIWGRIGVLPGQMPTLAQMRAAGPEMRQVVARTDDQLKTVLSAEQMRKFVRIRDELRDHMRAQAGLLD